MFTATATTSTTSTSNRASSDIFEWSTTDYLRGLVKLFKKIISRHHTSTCVWLCVEKKLLLHVSYAAATNFSMHSMHKSYIEAYCCRHCGEEAFLSSSRLSEFDQNLPPSRNIHSTRVSVAHTYFSTSLIRLKPPLLRTYTYFLFIRLTAKWSTPLCIHSLAVFF